MDFDLLDACQERPKGVACAPLTATINETLFYAQGGRGTHCGNQLL